MLDKLKKIIFRDKIVHNRLLVNRLNRILKNVDIEDYISTSVSKIYILNVYNPNFDTLLYNLNNNINNKNNVLLSVDVNNYFINTYDLHTKIERLVKYLKNNKISKIAEEELNEIARSLEYLTNLGDHNDRK